MVRTRLTENVADMLEPRSEGSDPTAPITSAPLVTYLATAECSLTGQVLSTRGGTILVNRNWSKGPHVSKDAEPWTADDLAAALPNLPPDAPYDRLAAAIDGALGSRLGDEGRAGIQRMVNAAMDSDAGG